MRQQQVLAEPAAQIGDTRGEVHVMADDRIVEARPGADVARPFGNAAYGNVGSGARLAYTVSGHDVILASRIADLCGRLGEHLLLSHSFQCRLSEHELRNLGAFSLKGIDEAQPVFAPVDG